MTHSNEAPSLREQVETVAYLRRVSAELQWQLREARQAFETEHQDLINHAGEAGSALARAELDLRKAALFTYLANGDKRPAPGVAIRMVKQVEYDPDEAVRWASTSGHLSVLSLNVAAFKAAAKKLADAGHGFGLPFVTITDGPEATIATDLAKALGES